MSSRLSALFDRLGGVTVWSGGLRSYYTVSKLPLRSDSHREMLTLHDGLIAFEGGLRCFGATAQQLPSLTEWNRPDGWRLAYHSLADGLLFFGEDAFGNQFAFEADRIVRFLAETADREFMADSLEDWLEILTNDPDEELGLWLLREWRIPDRALQPDEHLCPKVPFVAGGPYESSNLYALDRNQSMVFKGDFAWQTRNVPDGGKVRLKVVD